MRYYGFRPFGGRCDWSLFFTTPGGIAMMLVFAVVIGIIIYLAFSRRNDQTRDHRPFYEGERFEDPVYIAKKRFAQGEITREELDTLLDGLKKH
jgi:uncharacterized membrane protein